MPAQEKVERALQLLLAAGGKTLTVKEATDVIELVTAVPEVVRRVIEEGEALGLIERKEGRLVIRETDINIGPGEPRNMKKVCSDTCIRCGRTITSCHYIVMEDWQVGPLGSECVKKLRLD